MKKEMRRRRQTTRRLGEQLEEGDSARLAGTAAAVAEAREAAPRKREGSAALSSHFSLGSSQVGVRETKAEGRGPRGRRPSEQTQVMKAEIGGAVLLGDPQAREAPSDKSSPCPPPTPNYKRREERGREEKEVGRTLIAEEVEEGRGTETREEA